MSFIPEIIGIVEEGVSLISSVAGPAIIDDLPVALEELPSATGQASTIGEQISIDSGEESIGKKIGDKMGSIAGSVKKGITDNAGAAALTIGGLLTQGLIFGTLFAASGEAVHAAAVKLQESKQKDEDKVQKADDEPLDIGAFLPMLNDDLTVKKSRSLDIDNSY